MSAFAMADTLMDVAAAEAGAVGAVLQPAIMINFEFSLSKGNPVNLDTAGQKWRDAAAKIEQAKNQLQQAVAKLPPEAWTGDDRTAYEQKVRQLCEQFDVIHAYCMVVGVTLTTFAVALLLYAIFAVGMGTALMVILAVVLAEAATVVGAPAAIAEGESAAGTCLVITSVATGILAGVAEMAAGMFQLSAIGGTAMESRDGDSQAFDDLKRGEEEGAITASVNLAQNAANAGLNYLNRTGAKGTPLKSVDLDADVDKDGNWNAGGNAGVGFGEEDKQNITVGGHVQLHDGHVVGGQGEVNYTAPNGVSVGANGGRNSDGSWSGHVTGGYEPTYQGGKTHYYDANGEQQEYTPPGWQAGGNIDIGGGYDPRTGHWNGSVTGNQTLQGGTYESLSATVDNDGHGHGDITTGRTDWGGDQTSTTKY